AYRSESSSSDVTSTARRPWSRRIARISSCMCIPPSSAFRDDDGGGVFSLGRQRDGERENAPIDGERFGIPVKSEVGPTPRRVENLDRLPGYRRGPRAKHLLRGLFGRESRG